MEEESYELSCSSSYADVTEKVNNWDRLERKTYGKGITIKPFYHE